MVLQKTQSVPLLNKQKQCCEDIREKCVPACVIDYTEMRISDLILEYLRENEKVRETVLACSYGAHLKSFEQNK